MIKNIIVTGIGGQGVLYLSSLMRKLLAIRYGAVTGYDNRGGAQRLGHVSSVIRFLPDGQNKPMAIDFEDGKCDFLIGIEASEALRFNAKISKRTIMILDEFIIPPTNVRRDDSEYFKLGEIQSHFEKLAGKVVIKDFRKIAADRFNSHLYANILMFAEFLKQSGSLLDIDFIRENTAPAEFEKIRSGFGN